MEKYLQAGDHLLRDTHAQACKEIKYFCDLYKLFALGNAYLLRQAWVQD